ncbi:MAG: fused MFS/spermidine synthase [Candidatus Omnitrophota bacterium]|jgi:spermidine synthase
MAILIAIFIIGLSGIAAQIVILRELLVNFYGNELTVGIILANWVILEAGGVFLIGRFIDRAKNKLNVFIALNILFALVLPFCIYFSRIFKEAAGIPFMEAVSLSAIFISSFVIILPAAFLHGALFSCGCKVYALARADDSRSLGNVYSWEIIGTIIGGLVLAYLLIPFLNSFQIGLIISFLNLGFCIILTPFKKAKYLSLGILVFIFVIFFAPLANYLQKTSIQKQFSGQQVVDYRNSNYANITVIKKLEQSTFFYNGVPLITTPFPDKQFVEDFGNLPLLFHGAAQKVLVAGGGIGGIVKEVLKYPVKRIDYVEIDPLIIEMLRKHPSALSEEELEDKRVSVKNTDPRIFLRENDSLYDVILIGLSNQSDLSCNRFFTKDFFALAKSRLNPGGLIALWVDGSSTYLSQETKDLNSCILNSLRSVYKYVRVVPGDYNIFMASGAGSIMAVNSSLVSKRIAEGNIPVGLLIPDYLDYRLSDKLLDWFNIRMSSGTKDINLDLRPVAVYTTLEISNKKFSPQFNQVFAYFNYLNLKFIFITVLLMAAVIFFISRRIGKLGVPVVYAIFTTGFLGMSANLLLIFAYQVFYGYLYQKISILTAVFMAGIAAGSFLLVRGMDKIKNNKSALIILEVLLAAFSLILGFAISSFNIFSGCPVPVFYGLLFILGLLMGLEFPLAGKLCLKDEAGLGSVSGALYASDLIGGWLSGILTGIVFLPLLGFFDTCLVIFMLKLSSLIVLRSTR